MFGFLSGLSGGSLIQLGLVSGLSGGLLALLVLTLMAALWAAYRYFTASTPVDNVHPGKKHTHSCKFDSAEVERTKHAVKPPVVVVPMTPDARVATVLGQVDANVVTAALKALSGESEVTIG